MAGETEKEREIRSTHYVLGNCSGERVMSSFPHVDALLVRDGKAGEYDSAYFPRSTSLLMLVPPPHFLLLFLAVSVIFCYIKVFSHSCFSLPLHYTLLHPKQTLNKPKCTPTPPPASSSSSLLSNQAPKPRNPQPTSSSSSLPPSLVLIPASLTRSLPPKTAAPVAAAVMHPPL